MSKDRKDIYLGDGLKRALVGRRDNLSTAVNLIADRYQGIVERCLPAMRGEEIEVLRLVLRQFRDRRLEAHEIAALPTTTRDWLSRSQGAATPDLADKLAQLTYPELVALVDHLERT